jgi:hypothetical protein
MRTTKAEAAEVFRQFAWNLAGNLALPKLRRHPRAAASRPKASPLSRGGKA